MTEMTYKNEFPVTIYGNLKRIDDTKSRGRCRIFYKYKNRNGSYITDAFADKLLSTVAYTPVKGIYVAENNAKGDYTNHGEKRTEGRIYGIVPADYNLAWEDHLDDDGIIRNYACVDVILYTALYQEAGQILGKSQSMELYPKSIKGQWKMYDGQKYFEFTDGCFLGLQVLGDNTIPCFEGAAFYELDTIVDRLEKLETLFKDFQLEYIGGTSSMDTNDIITDVENVEEVVDAAEPVFEEVEETPISEEETVEETVETEETTEVDAVEEEEEKEVPVEEESIEEAEEAEEIEEEQSEEVEETEEIAPTEQFEQIIADLQATITTLTRERDDYAVRFSALEQKYNELEKVHNKNLKNEKIQIITKYSNKLDADTINEILENIDSYSITDLNKELSYAFVEKNPHVLSDVTGPLFPKQRKLTGAAMIVSEYVE